MSELVEDMGELYLAEGAENVVPEGYKLTEVGVIPEDWEACEIGDLNPYVTSGSRGWAAFYSQYGDVFVRITNMSRESIYLDLHSIRYVSVDEASSEGRRTSLINGDVLISITADIGICSYVDDVLPKPAFINQHIALVRFESKRVDSKFVAYYLSSFHIQKLFVGSADLGAKAGMNLDAVRKIQTALPRFDEQTAIATALSDIDALISEQEKLIAKKQAIKTATMQQLLTGRTRLPQFALREDGSVKGYKQSELGEVPEDWEVRPLSDYISGLEAGVSVNSIEEPDSYMKPSAILKTSCVVDGRFLYQEAKTIVNRDVGRAACRVSEGALIISRMNTPALVGECGYVDKAFNNLYLPDRLWQTKYRKGYEDSGLWLSFVLSYPPYARKIKELATGTSNSMKNISKGAILSFLIASPSIEEQGKVSSVLSSINREIEVLTNRLNKTRKIKQGMMQELLTGKTRLLNSLNEDCANG